MGCNPLAVNFEVPDEENARSAFIRHTRTTIQGRTGKDRGSGFDSRSLCLLDGRGMVRWKPAKHPGEGSIPSTSTNPSLRFRRLSFGPASHHSVSSGLTSFRGGHCGSPSRAAHLAAPATKSDRHRVFALLSHTPIIRERS